MRPPRGVRKSAHREREPLRLPACKTALMASLRSADEEARAEALPHAATGTKTHMGPPEPRRGSFRDGRAKTRGPRSECPSLHASGYGKATRSGDDILSHSHPPPPAIHRRGWVGKGRRHAAPPSAPAIVAGRDRPLAGRWTRPQGTHPPHRPARRRPRPHRAGMDGAPARHRQRRPSDAAGAGAGRPALRRAARRGTGGDRAGHEDASRGRRETRRKGAGEAAHRRLDSHIALPFCDERQRGPCCADPRESGPFDAGLRCPRAARRWPFRWRAGTRSTSDALAHGFGIDAPRGIQACWRRCWQGRSCGSLAGVGGAAAPSPLVGWLDLSARAGPAGRPACGARRFAARPKRISQARLTHPRYRCMFLVHRLQRCPRL